MLKRLIAVNPNQRPTCDQILTLDVVQKYIKKLGLPEDDPTDIVTLEPAETAQQASFDSKAQLL
jgi:hypothetical protein